MVIGDSTFFHWVISLSPYIYRISYFPTPTIYALRCTTQQPPSHDLFMNLRFLHSSKLGDHDIFYIMVIIDTLVYPFQSFWPIVIIWHVNCLLMITIQLLQYDFFLYYHTIVMILKLWCWLTCIFFLSSAKRLDQL